MNFNYTQHRWIFISCDILITQGTRFLNLFCLEYEKSWRRDNTLMYDEKNMQSAAAIRSKFPRILISAILILKRPLVTCKKLIAFLLSDVQRSRRQIRVITVVCKCIVTRVSRNRKYAKSFDSEDVVNSVLGNFIFPGVRLVTYFSLLSFFFLTT